MSTLRVDFPGEESSESTYHIRTVQGCWIRLASFEFRQSSGNETLRCNDITPILAEYSAHPGLEVVGNLTHFHQ